MSSFREFILERLAAWDPTLDLTDAVLLREVVNPLVAHTGAELPLSDPIRLLKARLSAEFPDIESSVFGDLFGRAAESLFSVLHTQFRMAESRRRLDDPRVLAQGDLADSLDVFLLEPAVGGYARGVFRAFFSTPRALVVYPNTALRVPARNGQPERIYYPVNASSVSASTMRDSRDEQGRYYFDVEVVSSAVGPAYNLSPGEALGCSGVPGAVRVTNLSAVTNGVRADDTLSMQAKIRSVLRYRALASRAGAEYILPSIGVFDFVTVLGGDRAMRRDRVIGVSSISGVPNGFVYPAPIVPDGGALTPYISLGLAYDIWIAPDTRQALSTTDIRNVEDVGIELMRGLDGRFQFFATDDLDGEPKYRLTLRSPRFLEIPTIEDDWPRLAGNGLFPITAGDIVYFEKQYTDQPGQRQAFRVVVGGVRATATGGSLLILEGDPAFYPDPLENTNFDGSHWSVYRPMALTGGRQVVSVPLVDVRALDALGDEVSVGGFPAMPKPGSTLPDYVESLPLPRTANWVVDPAGLPVLGAERLELLDAVTDQPGGDYVYPRHPLYMEFLDSISGIAADKLVRVRVHIQGPQAAAFPATVIFSSEGNGTVLRPATWGAVAATTPPEAFEVDFITLSSLPSALPYRGGNTLVERAPRPGDWALFTGTTGAGEPYVFQGPILAIEAGGILRFEASDILGNLTGTCVIVQGTSRAVQLAAGRGPEGTWSVDVWCQEATEGESGVTGYVPSNPPVYGTQAHADPRTLLTQGFELLGSLPGHYFSGQERPSILLEGAHGLDGQAWQNRSIRIHAFASNKVAETQTLISSDANRPVGMQGLAKLYSPTFLHVAVYYDAESLLPEDAAKAMLSALETADREDRLDLSDLVAELTRRGADYVTTGRLFAAQQDDRREWTCYATRGSVPVLEVGDLYFSCIVCTRLRRRKKGEALDELNPDNWIGQYILRPGGFDAD